MDKFVERVNALVKEYNLPVAKRGAARLKQNIKSERGRGVGKITPKQLRYIENYLKTGDTWKAYHAAGYKSMEDVPKRYARRSIYNVHNSKNIQRFLGEIMHTTLLDLGITAKNLAEKAMDCYQEADTVKEKMEALKLITRILPVVDD